MYLYSTVSHHEGTAEPPRVRDDAEQRAEVGQRRHAVQRAELLGSRLVLVALLLALVLELVPFEHHLRARRAALNRHGRERVADCASVDLSPAPCPCRFRALVDCGSRYTMLMMVKTRALPHATSGRVRLPAPPTAFRVPSITQREAA
eukprot:scaffold23148_cov130-Isochrysis_galbana.AAC.5